MPKRNNTQKQTSQYDKIIKENLEITLPAIIKDLLGLHILMSEELPDDMQHTKERKPDALKKVTDIKGNTYVLHVEFQVEDEKEMVYRMAEYSVMLMRRYKLPIKQYVVFLKDTNPTMPTSIDTLNHKFNYQLIHIAKADYNLFLKSTSPEIKMLGILANFGQEDSFTVIKSIVEEVRFFTKVDFAESRYFKQLRIFVQLRNSIEQQFEKAMETVTKFFKEENDFLYRKGETKGLEIGEEKKSHIVVENLILKLGLSDEQAAEVADVSINFVKQVRNALKSKQM